MARFDKNSITATKTEDPAVFQVEFDFTDDMTTAPELGYTLTWLHARFSYNTAMTTAQFNAAAAAAMAAARKPDTEAALETTLRSRFGTVFVREDPNPPEPAPMKVQVVTV